MKKDSSKYENLTEYQKALNFLEEGCGCNCSSKVPKEEFAELRSNFQTLSKPEQDAFLMAQLKVMDGGTASKSPRLKDKIRINRRIFYQWDHNTPICLETYLNMLGISHKYLWNVKSHLLDKSVKPRTHGNTGRTPWRKTKMVVDQEVREIVKNFILNYAETHGLPDPGKSKRGNQAITFLPTETSYKSVHREFLGSLKENDNLKQLKYDIFRRLWHQLTPNIQFMNIRTDLCDKCQQFRNELHSCKSEKEKEELKKISST